MTKQGSGEALPQDPGNENMSAQEVLHEYFQSRIGRQKRTAEATGILPSTLSSMARGRIPIGFEAAVLIDVASEGAVSAKLLCPKRADVLEKFVRLHAEEVKAPA